MQEFRVSTNNVSAEFGGYGGGVIQIATKSGTNKFHGNAYEYFRNTALNANNWFSNHNGTGKITSSPEPVPVVTLPGLSSRTRHSSSWAMSVNP